MNLLRRAHRKLPPRVQALLRPALFVLGSLRRHELRVIEGAERSGGEPLTIAYAGTPDLKDTLVKRAFAPGARERSLGTIPIWLSSRAIARLAPRADLVARRVPAHYEGLPRGEAFARLPAWVGMKIDLTDPECAAKGREKLARLRARAWKAGFAFEIATGEAAFVEFFDLLHAPYVRLRHGDGAALESREETLDGLRRGALSLLSVRRGGEAVAAGTVEFDGAAARFRHLGVRDGNPALLKEGAGDAVYSFVMDEARARGCRTLHLGRSRPFARDGVLEYKRMLGAFLFKDEYSSRGSLELAASRWSGGLRDFLADNPLIAEEPDGRRALYGFVSGGEKEARESAARWRARYCFKDTLGLRVFMTDGPVRRELPV